jgi:hypothetical protein
MRWAQNLAQKVFSHLKLLGNNLCVWPVFLERQEHLVRILKSSARTLPRTCVMSTK